MKNAALIGTVFLLPLTASAWVRSNAPASGDPMWWGENPKIWTNTSTPAQFRPKVIEGVNAWKWSGARTYPYHGGTTGRDCGDGDTWWYDNDDGYNVVDYWDHCNDGVNFDWWDSRCGSSLAFARPIDEYNTDWGRLAEVDIVMCSDQTWTTAYNHAGVDNPNYQATLTHEVGHLMGLNHTDVNAGTQVIATMHQNQAITGAGHPYGRTYDKLSLSWDDVDAVRSIYGSCSANDWVVTDNAGQYLNIEGQGTSGYDCGVDYNVEIRTPGQGWTVPVAIKNSRLGGWVKPNTVIDWSEIDWSHSNIVTLMVTGTDGVQRELNYARNASNHWHRQGWLGPHNPDGVANFYNVYSAWRNCRGMINADYLSEWGVEALYVEGVFVKHFVDTNLPAHVWQRAWTDNFRIQRR